MVVNPEASTVAIITAPKSIPVFESIAGLTNMIYDIVINVVMPAMTSVITVVLFSFNLKTFSNISIPFPLLKFIKRCLHISMHKNIK